MRAIDADALQLAIVEEGQANKRKKYSIGDIWELTGAEIREVINSMPTIQLEPHWIPVTERLPEEDVDVLCQTLIGARLVASYGILNPWDIEKGWITAEFNRFSKEMVKAWMPLPDPHKGVTT